MECKHEKGLDAVVYEDLEARFVNEDCVVSYHCGKGCGDIYKGEVEIFPKTPEEIRSWTAVGNTIIALTIAERKKYKEWESMKYEGEINNDFLIFTDKKNAVWKDFKGLLDALDNAIEVYSKYYAQ